MAEKPQAFSWEPIAHMREEDRYKGNYLLHGPDLVHPDFNPEGVEVGHWQDGEGWMVPRWNNDAEEWDTGVVEVTHYAPVPRGPHSFTEEKGNG